MKIRIIGTSEECESARKYYEVQAKRPNVKSVNVSRMYPCRDSHSLFRLYVDIDYFTVTEETKIGGKMITGK